MREEENFNERTNEITRTDGKTKKGWAKFIVAILILSIVGGSASGVSYYMLEKYFNQRGVVIKSDSSGTFYDGTEKSIVEIANEVGGSIVGITTKVIYRDWLNNLRTVEGAGSGIIFKIDTDFVYILTNNHVVDDADELLVEFNEDMLVEATIVGSDADTDIGVIKVALEKIDSGSAGKLKPVVLGDSDSIKVGETAITIGNPLGYKNTITVGVISALDRNLGATNALNLIQTDAAINPGNSGGALVNIRGEVIGMNTIKISDTKVEGIGFALPVNEVKPIVDELLDYGYVSKPVLGIAGRSIDEELSKLYDLPMGILVLGVYKDSGADRIGIERGDLVVSINDTSVSSIRELSDYLTNYKSGDIVDVKVLREGSEEMIFKLKLIDRSELKDLMLN